MHEANTKTVRLLTLFYCAQGIMYMLIVLKSGSLNLLETSGPLQACNGIALPSTKALCRESATYKGNNDYHLFLPDNR
jgi:hypothetical protein